MSLVADISMGIVVTMVGMVIIFVFGSAAVPIGDFVQDRGGIDKYDGDQFINGTQDVMFLWVPLLGIAGTWIVVGIRHYRRQRIEAARRRTF